MQISDFVIGKSAERMQKRRNAPEYGLAEWQGLVRTVDRAESWMNNVFRCLPLPLLRLAGNLLYPHLS